MPIDVLATYKDGSQEMFYISMNELMGNKSRENKSIKWTVLDAWNWVNPTYTFTIDKPISEIQSLEIDPSQRMADIKRENNLMKMN